MDKPQYYGKSPASVRYDSALSDFAKVLYPDIEALTRKNGFCHAENGYWAELFGKSERSIRRAISELFSRGHIDIVGEGKARKIYVSNPDKNVLVQDANPDKNVQPTRTNLSKNPDKNVHDIYGNNTIKNTTRENTDAREKFSQRIGEFQLQKLESLKPILPDEKKLLLAEYLEYRWRDRKEPITTDGEMRKLIQTIDQHSESKVRKAIDTCIGNGWKHLHNALDSITEEQPGQPVYRAWSRKTGTV